MLEHIYVLQRVTGGWEAERPSRTLLPWTVVLLVGSHSKRHIFRPSVLRWKTVHANLEDFANRIRWKVALRGSQSGDRPLLRRRVRSCTAAMFDATTQPKLPELEGFIRGLKNVVVKRCRAVVGSRSPLPSYVQHARRWLRDHDLVPVLSDKDGVFCLPSRSALNELARLQLSQNFYRAVGPANLHMHVQLAKGGMARCAKALEPISMPWSRELRKHISSLSEHSIVCELLLTVKTHKVPVATRCIHDSSRNGLNALSKAIHNVLNPKLASWEFLCRGSTDVSSKLKGLELTPTATFMKFDVRDFYLSGDHEFLINVAVEAMSDPNEKSFLREGLKVVLSHQFVRSSYDGSLSEVVFQVQRGSGIGMIHAGSLADTVFAKSVEAPLHGNPEFREGILRYLRFRDDVLVIAKSPAHARKIKELFISLASVFCEVKVEDISLVGVSFLDFFVHRDKVTSTCIAFCPHVKESARHIPLSSRSYHHPAIHRSWPISEARRMAARSSSEQLAKSWIAAKVSRFKRFMLDEGVVAACNDVSKLCMSHVAAWALRENPVEESEKFLARLVLPFRRELQLLSAELNLYLSERQTWFKATFGFCLAFQLCWSSAGPNLTRLICGR